MSDDQHSLDSALVRRGLPPRRPSVRLALGLTGALYIVGYIPVLLLSMALLRVAETTESRMVSLALLCLFPGTLLLWASWMMPRLRKKLLFAVAGLLCSASVVLLVLTYARTPRGVVMGCSEVRSVFRGKARYVRCSPANLVPEIDQLKLGSYLFARTDPMIDTAKSRRIRKLCQGIYRDMRGSKEFRAMGSVLNYAYRDLLFGSMVRGHFFEFVPSDPKNRKVPAIIFLHGSLGSFKGYFWLWSAFGKANSVAVLQPTFGAGNWDCDDGESWIREVTEYCRNHPRIDENHIYLVGISNGAKGVSRAAVATPGDYAGLVYLSPAPGKDLLPVEGFADKWEGKPILVLHGISDDRVPVSIVEQWVAEVNTAGLTVDAIIYEDEDHYLFFSDPETVLEDVGDWIRLMLDDE